MSVGKPIELMHRKYGVIDEKCEACCNLVIKRFGTRIIRKCTAYGCTCSQKSDWVKSWQACGLLNKPVTSQMVPDSAKRAFFRGFEAKVVEVPLDGQIDLFEAE